jgi:hypothetical protein
MRAGTKLGTVAFSCPAPRLGDRGDVPQHAHELFYFFLFFFLELCLQRSVAAQSGNFHTQVFS